MTMAPFSPKIQQLRDMQKQFQQHTGVRDYSAKDGISPGICHQVAREQFVDPGDFIQADVGADIVLFSVKWAGSDQYLAPIALNGDGGST